MKKIIVMAIAVMICVVSSFCYAFELNRNEWINFAVVNDVECYYNTKTIQRQDEKAKIWLCYHYPEQYDIYRLQYREYTRGSNKVRILKQLDYFSDGTLKQGSVQVVENVGFGENEEVVLRVLWGDR